MPNMPVRRNRENRLARRENDHMKKILQPLFSLNMKARIYILVATAVIVSTAAASLFSFFRYKEDLSEKVSRTNRQLLEQVADNLDSYFDDLVRLSYAPAYNTALIEQLEQIRSGFEEAHQELETRRSIEKFLDEMMIYPRKDILHATLVVGHQVFYGSRTRLSVSPSADPETLDWYKQAQENAGGPVYVGPHLDPFLQNEDTVVVSVVNVIRSLKDPQAVLAFVKVNADFSAIERICRQIDLGEGGGLLLLDDAGREVFRSVGQIQAEKLHTLGENGMLYADGGRYLVYQMPVEKPGWRLYGFVSQKTLQSDALETSRLSLMLGAACAALTVALLLLALKAMLAPLYKIMAQIKLMGMGDFHVRFPDRQQDEVGMMGRTLNEVVQQLEEAFRNNALLETRVLRAQLAEKESQVSLLYSQIQPHFIYNTMNMISMLIQLGRTEAAVQNIERLSLLLRSMSRGSSSHTLRQEMQQLQAYLEIQSDRYGGALRYQIEYPKTLADTAVPTLLLQPLVENAVIHGHEESGAAVFVHVTVTQEQGIVTTCVSDDGKGIPAEKLEELRRRMRMDDRQVEEEKGCHGGTGLRNVNRRIQLRYGDEYGLQIESMAGRGTVVTVRFPAEGGSYDPDASC